MKPISVLLAFSVMLLGCYSQSPLLKNELPPTDEAAIFYLNDGSQIASGAREHARIDGGYEVAGSLSRPERSSVPFKGVLHDREIQKITTEQFDLARTSIAVPLAAGTLFVFVLTIGFITG